MPLAPTSPVTLALTPNPLLSPATGSRSVAAIEQELQRLPHLKGDSRHNRREHKAALIDARAMKTASEALGNRLPDPDEGIHMVISGRFALFDHVPAVLSIAGCKIEALTIATLGFSVRNIVKLCSLIDAGEIGEVYLLASHYFAGTSAKIYNVAVKEFAKRPDRMKFLSVRQHAKILAIAMADGRHVTMESSANLRSTKNVETCTAFGSRTLFEFHAGWIRSLFTAARA
jgi:hypothetical protein